MREDAADVRRRDGGRGDRDFFGTGAEAGELVDALRLESVGFFGGFTFGFRFFT